MYAQLSARLMCDPLWTYVCNDYRVSHGVWCIVHQWLGRGLMVLGLTTKSVHIHVRYETRVYWNSGTIPVCLFNLLNVARRPAAEGPARQTWSTHACVRAQRIERTLWFTKLLNVHEKSQRIVFVGDYWTRIATGLWHASNAVNKMV